MQLALQAQWDLKALRAYRVKWDRQDQQDQQDLRVQLVLQAHLGHKEYRDLSVLPEQWAHKDPPVRTEQQGHRDRLD